MNRKNWSVFVALLATVLVPVAAIACPNCKSMLEDNSASTNGSMAGGFGGSMAAGYYYSILFMLTMLFSMIGTLFFVIRREARQTAVEPSITEPS